jgi:hypothetical protein
MRKNQTMAQLADITTPMASDQDREFRDIINALDILVIEDDLAASWGRWDHATGVIVLKAGLGSVQRRSVLARMLGHAVLGHEEMSTQAEEEAAQWAARRLVNPARAAAVLKSVNWLGMMARELEVMPSDLAAFLASLTCKEQLKIRDAIAMEPRGY